MKIRAALTIISAMPCSYAVKAIELFVIRCVKRAAIDRPKKYCDQRDNVRKDSPDFSRIALELMLFAI